MSTVVGSLEQLAGELARVFEPLVQRAETGTLDEVLPWLGLRSYELEPDATALDNALTATATAAAELTPLINDLAQAVTQDDRAAIAATVAALLQQLRATLQGIEEWCGPSKHSATMQPSRLDTRLNSLPSLVCCRNGFCIVW